MSKRNNDRNKKTRLSVLMILVVSMALIISCGTKTEDEKPSLSLSNSDMTMKIGDTVKLKASYENNQDAAKVTWSSDDSSVVTVTDKGKVEAVGTGETAITVADESGIQAKCYITVKEIEVESVTLNEEKATLDLKESIQLEADVYPEEASAREVEWVSDDDDIAVVNASGLVTGKKGGIVNIICRSSNGKEASCTVVVENPAETEGKNPFRSNREDSEIQDNGGQDHDTDVNENAGADEDADAYAPFYGIWCGAAKSESGAEKEANALRDKGLDVQVFFSPDWSNLNQEEWYVITAGVHASEADAKNYLPTVQAVYPGAYIKYSGEYQR